MATLETTYLVPERRDNEISQSSKTRFSVMSIVSRLERQLELRRSRMALLEMSDDQLKDIALSRADAYREAHRRFWD
ncbi:DUF1127 domain-containing protein [Pararhizobium sp. BT-229]|uniref:DUF1127 domain-containing protein n=1 Tax=Pararhizobium sp. BT-229 TaxID=2986923 RepID=UPI0021F7AA5A|nr:DUF1127 domain-containing protein [Pararhizobium sp. BT-229]MCV9961983.1 DUF1127 domain-containing protein [Pararhizobium sp. BT-229]